MIITSHFPPKLILSSLWAPSPWRLLNYIKKNLWRRMLEANKKQVPLKSYSLEIKIHFVNQMLKNKEKVKLTHNISMLTRITDQKILYVYIHVYWITKNWGPGPYNFLHQADNRRYFLGPSLMPNRREVHVLLGEGIGKIRTCSCWEKAGADPGGGWGG